MSQKLNKKEIKDFLKSHFIMEAATISKNRPHASVLLYHMENDFSFYIVTRKNTYKAKNLLKNPYISFTIWEHNKMMIQTDGNVLQVKETGKKLQNIIDKLAIAATKDNGFWPPLFRIGHDDYIIFHIKPTWMRAMNLQNSHITEVEPPFTNIKL